jgi:fibronectin-binding autotransporter adhesin
MQMPFHSLSASRPSASPAVLSSLLVLASAAVPLHAQTTLGVGDIQVTGVTSDSNDSFTFVLWKDISSGTVIRFMDKSFTNATTSVIGTGEDDMSLTFSSALSAGTVIRVEDTGATLVNGGTFSGTKTGSLNGINAGGDQVFVYQGNAMGTGTSFSGRTLLYGFNIADTSWVTSSADENNSFLPTAISGLDANIDSGNSDNADYTGTRTGMTTAAYRAAVGNIANFTQSNTRSNLATGGFTSTASVALHWDANGTTANNGGTGTWDSTTQSRFKNGASGTTYLHWVNSSTGNDHTAVFGGAAGTVSVSGGVTASGLQFDVDGYTIQSSTITLAGTTPTIQVTTTAHTATVSSVLAGSNGLTKSGAGTLISAGANNYSGGTTVSAGTLQIGSGGTTGALGGGAVANSGTLRFSRTDSYGGTVSNAISGTGAVALSAGTLTLGGSNTYTGATTVTAGTLKLGAIGALGNGTNNTSGVSINATGAALDLSGFTPTANVALNLNGTGVSSAGALTNSGGAASFGGVVTLQTNSTIGGTGNVTLGNNFSGAFGLTYGGSGRLILSGASNGATTTTINSGGTLQIGNGGTTGTLGSGAVTNNGALVFNRSNNFSVSTTIAGSGTLTKEGDGIMTLLGINNYSGDTIINDGKLAVDGTAASSSFTVNNGGILGGNGSTGAVTVASGGRVGPGNSAGSLETGNLNLQSGGFFDIELNGAAPGTGYDQINVTGSATLAGLLAVTVDYTPEANSLFFILVNDGSDAVSGTFTGLANNSVFNVSGQDFKISYFANSTGNTFSGGNDVALMAVPEPTASLLVGLGGIALLGRRRR